MKTANKCYMCGFQAIVLPHVFWHQSLKRILCSGECVRSLIEEEKKEEEKDIADRLAKYDELILAVGLKFPDESRHETALRYIQEAEDSGDNVAKINID